ncbi:MAG TPA: hypothetical protein VEZ11_07060 [Thermoanaerobaculia bacterium]|nr:hypothetical protein [Thermoanaerobaculia bacterium]
MTGLRSVLAAIILCTSTSIIAEDFERVLLPISGGAIPGAYGSLWEIHLVVRNDNSTPTRVTQHPFGCAIPCPLDLVDPNTSLEMTTYPVLYPHPGSYLWITKPGNAHVTFNLRIQDLSRQALTWGTEIPVLHDSSAHTGVIELLSVPLDSRFRQTLRVYDFDDAFGRRVRLRIYPSTSNEAAVDVELKLTTPSGGDFANVPGYAQVGSFVDAFPQLAALDNVRVELTPIDAGLRFWAFVTVTNNETQHVTTITPQ